MSSSSNVNNETAGNTSSNSNTAIATSTKSSEAPKKKKPMIQHLLAGGTAGFVESSVCHPLDTIKTRMQLRRQNTIKSRALGSLRDADGGGGRALHRTTSSGDATDKKASNVTAKNETVRVKPDLSKANASASSSNSNNKGPLHDVGWKQRTVTSASSTVVEKTAAKEMNAIVVAPLGPFGTAKRIIQREGPLALYKGLTAVYTGIVPKMAIRFVSFEYYRDVLGGWYGKYAGMNNNSNQQSTQLAAPPPGVTFIAGLLSGLTEAILVVTPAEVCKIRMQSQYHSLMDPSQMLHAKYKNVVQTAALVVKEEGLGALYKGVVPTMLRQGCNQAVNFTVYNWSKKQILSWKKKKEEEKMGGAGVVGEVTLDHWQSLLLGGLSGGMGPLVNNPLGEFVYQIYLFVCLKHMFFLLLLFVFHGKSFIDYTFIVYTDIKTVIAFDCAVYYCIPMEKTHFYRCGQDTYAKASDSSWERTKVQESLAILYRHCQRRGNSCIVEGNYSSTYAYNAWAGYNIYDV